MQHDAKATAEDAAQASDDAQSDTGLQNLFSGSMGMFNGLHTIDSDSGQASGQSQAVNGQKKQPECDFDKLSDQMASLQSQMASVIRIQQNILSSGVRTNDITGISQLPSASTQGMPTAPGRTCTFPPNLPQTGQASGQQVLQGAAMTSPPYDSQQLFAGFHRGHVQPQHTQGQSAGVVPGLRNTEGFTEFSSIAPVEGMSEKTIKSALSGEFVHLDEFLHNYSFASDNFGEMQSYVDPSGNLVCRSKRQKRRINNFNTWLEAWSAYEKLMIMFHGLDLYSVLADYKMLIMQFDRKYLWTSVAMFDVKHRVSLSRKSVEFTKVDTNLVTTTFDSTTVKTSATRCHRCKSFDHIVGECPFPAPAQKTQRPEKTQFAPKTSAEVCNNFNTLRCVFSNCKRLHVCKACRGDLPYELCIKQGKCATSKFP